MRLRRISHHVKDQNWFAVALDFFIVVAGVYIGIQLGNWNEARNDRQEYNLALERYKSEIKTNIEKVDRTTQGTLSALKTVESGFDALLSCEETPENRILVNAGINKIMGTLGLQLQTTAMDALIDDPVLHALQSEADRKRLGDTQFLINVFLREANFVEVIPLDERTQNNPIIKIGEKHLHDVTYAGADYSRVSRKLELNLPINIACQDNTLIKSFYTWERWQGALPAATRIIREQLQANLDYYGE